LFGDILRTLENKRKGNNEIDNNYSEEDNLSNEFESDSDDDID